MFKLQYRHIAVNVPFNNSFQALAESKALYLPTKVLIKSIKKEVRKHLETYQEMFNEIRKELIEMEGDKPKLNAEGKIVFLEGKTEKDFDAKMKELLQVEVEINCQRIKASVLDKAELSANDLDNLQDMIEWDIEV